MKLSKPRGTRDIPPYEMGCRNFVKNSIEQVFECLCRDFTKDGITVNIKVPEDMVISAVPVQFQQVLMNLILNARDAILPAGGAS